MQCLSNTRELAQYFGDGAYVPDVNLANVLGRQGRVAHAFAGLMHAMWSGRFGSVSPKAVKSIVSAYAPQFDGWQQHDSQEVRRRARTAGVRR
jgi:ubiquitin C-terminal hydrolase